MPLGRSGREPVGDHENRIEGSDVGVGAREPTGVLRVKLAAQIRSLQERESILGRTVNRDGVEFQLVKVGEQAGNVEGPVHSVTRASMGELEGKVGARGKTAAHVSQPDPGGR